MGQKRESRGLALSASASRIRIVKILGSVGLDAFPVFLPGLKPMQEMSDSLMMIGIVTFGKGDRLHQESGWSLSFKRQPPGVGAAPQLEGS